MYALKNISEISIENFANDVYTCPSSFSGYASAPARFQRIENILALRCPICSGFFFSFDLFCLSDEFWGGHFNYTYIRETHANWSKHIAGMFSEKRRREPDEIEAGYIPFFACLSWSTAVRHSSRLKNWTVSSKMHQQLGANLYQIRMKLLRNLGMPASASFSSQHPTHSTVATHIFETEKAQNSSPMSLIPSTDYIT